MKRKGIVSALHGDTNAFSNEFPWKNLIIQNDSLYLCLFAYITIAVYSSHVFVSLVLIVQ